MQAILQELVYESLHEGAVWPFDRNYIRPPHFHGQLELLVIAAGTATLHLGTRAVTVRKGQLAWILPGVPHVMSDFSADFDMWVVQLDAAVVGASWLALNGPHRDDAPSPGDPFSAWVIPFGDRLGGRATVEVSGDEARALVEAAALIWGASSSVEARHGLRAVCDQALRSTLGAGIDGVASSLGDLASCLMLASPSSDRATVAAALGVSEGFLSRRFHRELGVTFVEHRARTRVAHFLALVQHDERKLLAAALDAGFGSYSQFHRTFTRLAGSRPSEYLDGGRQRSELLVAGDLGRPEAGAPRTLPGALRQRAPVFV